MPSSKVREVAAMLMAVHTQENREAPEGNAVDVVEKLKVMKQRIVAELVASAIHETLAFYAYPPQHWLKLKTNNPMERLFK